MRRTILLAASAAMLLTCIAAAQAPANATWNGVWQGELDGQPAVTLTLADDGGALEGTVVFNLIERQTQGPPRVASIQPHVLLDPQSNGSTLSFQIMRPDRSEAPLKFTVTLDGNDKARIHCLNCGPDAPVAELVRMESQH
jgi:hypothetical protein